MSRNVGMLVQAILVECLAIFIFINFFIPLELMVEILLILVLLVMSYNNYNEYKRKKFTILYALGALLVLFGVIYG